jgi:hypothetical protein
MAIGAGNHSGDYPTLLRGLFEGSAAKKIRDRNDFDRKPVAAIEV